MNKREVMAMAEDARRLPAREAEFRNLILNQRVEASNPFVTPSIWKSNGSPALPFAASTPLYGGLDLSSVADLTALILIGQPDQNKWHVHPTFWLPTEGLAEKSRNDRVPYDVWAKQGFLETTEGNSIKYEYVAHELRDLFTRYNIRKLAFDRWNMKHLKPWLEKAGFSPNMIEDRFVEFGQGTQSMSPGTALTGRTSARQADRAWQPSGAGDVRGLRRGRGQGRRQPQAVEEQIQSSHRRHRGAGDGGRFRAPDAPGRHLDADRVKAPAKILVRCVACKNQRAITARQAAKGQPFCPKCGNVEVAVKVTSK